MSTELSTDPFVFACKLSDLTPNVAKALEVDDRFVVVVLLSDGHVYCVEDLCTHDGGTLGDGELIGNCLVCPRHGAKFDVKTGDAVCMPATEGTISHPVKIHDDEVFVWLKDN
jgi:3-phenylpropionate/trans-cinnamate dioxygenase ferredoxin component